MFAGDDLLYTILEALSWHPLTQLDISDQENQDRSKPYTHYP